MDVQQLEDLYPDPQKISVVQFSSFLQYADEEADDHVQEIDVMRIGRLDTQCEVQYRTEKSAFADIKFVPLEGIIVFEPGQSISTIKLELKDNDSYDDVVEVIIRLDHPKDCQIYHHLRTTRVMIIDTDVYPTNKFREKIEQDHTAKHWRRGRDFAMLIEYAKSTYANNKTGARKSLLADQINNLIMFSQLFVNRMIINELSDGDPDLAVVIELGLCLLVPYGITHILSYNRQYWKVGGAARKVLWKGLLEKYLYYEEASRAVVDSSEFKQVYFEETYKLVDRGYMNFFALISSAGRIFMVSCFLIYLAIDDLILNEKVLLFLLLIPQFVIPFLIAGYLCLRLERTDEARLNAVSAKVQLIHHMSNCVNQYSLVAASQGRWLVLEQCEKKIKELNDCIVVQKARQANDEAFFEWVSHVLEFGAIAGGGWLFVNKSIPLGTFTSTLNGLRVMMAQFLQLYLTLVDMQSTLPSVWYMVTYMNHPTDLILRKDEMESTQTIFKTTLEDVTQQAKPNSNFIPEDNLEISFKNVFFMYDRSSPFDSTVFHDLTFSIKLGEFVAFSGGTGCRTALKLLSGVLLPSVSQKGNRHGGHRFVPPYLRCLYLEYKESLWEAPVAESIFFGYMTRDKIHDVRDIPHAEVERGLRICKLLRMPDKVIQAIEDDIRGKKRSSKQSESSGNVEAEDHWDHYAKVIYSFSASSLKKIQLACALVSDPEVLVINQPLHGFSCEDAKNVIVVLRKFVEERGLESPSESRAARRPRTCVIACKGRFMLAGVDRILSLTEGGHVEEEDMRMYSQVDEDRYHELQDQLVKSKSKDVVSSCKSVQAGSNGVDPMDPQVTRSPATTAWVERRRAAGRAARPASSPTTPPRSTTPTI